MDFSPALLILKCLGVTILLLASIICVTFLVWVIKLEFAWFFDTNIFLWTQGFMTKIKNGLVKFVKWCSEKAYKLNHKPKKLTDKDILEGNIKFETPHEEEVEIPTYEEVMAEKKKKNENKTV